MTNGIIRFIIYRDITFLVKIRDRVLFKKIFAFIASSIFFVVFYSCSTSAGGSQGAPGPSNTPSNEIFIKVMDYSITIKEIFSDISVVKAQSGTVVIFTAEDCDSYEWTFEEKTVGTEKTYSIDTASLLKGTYTLSLEVTKDGKRRSYYSQIKVGE